MNIIASIASDITMLGLNFGHAILGPHVPLVGEAMGVFLIWLLALASLKGLISLAIRLVLFRR